ncbi:MAG: LAGLIDADG family homing endonuclease [Nanoarchaeota archaeon]
MNSKERIVKLKIGEQRKLFTLLANKFGSLKKVADLWGIPYSSLKNYSLEILFLPEKLFDKILGSLSIKKESLNFTYLNTNWGKSLGGKRGMAALQKKYPKKIIKWRKKARKNSAINNMKEIQIPSLDENLAEFIGAYLGDGTITKYQIRISGDNRYDYLYYNYLSNIIMKLFDISPSIRKEKNTNTHQLVIYSKNVCSFLNKNFGIKYGDKIMNKATIPKRIIKNKRLSIACLRGLIDTDGSISRRGRKGNQFCIQFTSHNEYLLKQVNEIGKRLKVFTFNDKTGTETNKWDNIIRYFQIIGSSNPKHIIRFLLRKDGKTIYRDDLPYYFKQEKYRTLNLPFTLRGV